ncbi:unnamed protein product [Closterium sp. NIES-53]
MRVTVTCASAYAAPGAGESAPSGTTPAQVFHTFTLDSGASRSFFRDRTTLTPLSRPVAVSLADPSGGPVLASFSPSAPGLLAGDLPHLAVDGEGWRCVCVSGLGISFNPPLLHSCFFTSRAFVRDLSADKLSPRVVPCVFLGFPPDAPGWQFYHPTSRRVLSSQDVTFDESVPYYRLFSYRTASLPPPPLFLAPGPPPVDPLPPQGPAPTGVSQVDAVEPVEVAVDSGAATGAEPAGTGSGGAGSGGAETGGAEPGGAGSGGAETWGAEPGGLTERRAPASRPASPARPACTSRRTSRPRPPAVPGTHQMALRPSTAPLRVPLPSPPASSLPAIPDPESDFLCAASPTVARFLATVVTDPSLASTAASALVAELVDFAARCRLDYAASLVAESASVCPSSVGGECALSMDVLEDRQEEFQCFAAALPHLVSTLLAPEGDPDPPDIPTPRSYAEAIEGPYSSQWQAAMDAEMASWKSTGTYVDEVPPPGANIVSGMWIFRVKRPPGSPPVFKVRYVARGFSQRQGVDYFQTFSPTPKMTTLWVLLHVAAQRDYELHSLDFSTAFLQGSLHEEIWLRCPPGFTGSFPPGTQWSLRRPVYGLRQAPREWSTRRVGLEEHVRRDVLSTRFQFSHFEHQRDSSLHVILDNKAMLALCREHRLEHRTKHIALRYFLARELQQRGQLRLAYVASEANTTDIFTKALAPGDHQRFCTLLGLVPTWPHLLTS